MSDLILRIDAKRRVCIYRTKTRQGVFMSLPELAGIAAGYHELNTQEPYAINVGCVLNNNCPQEFHRLITETKRGAVLVGALQPDLFHDVRKEEHCK